MTEGGEERIKGKGEELEKHSFLKGHSFINKPRISTTIKHIN